MYNSVLILIYKYLNEIISSTISNLTNSSVLEIYFVLSLRQASITPIHKSGSTSIISIYRLILILPTFSKYFYKLMRKRFKHYLEN